MQIVQPKKRASRNVLHQIRIYLATETAEGERIHVLAGYICDEAQMVSVRALVKEALKKVDNSRITRMRRVVSCQLLQEIKLVQFFHVARLI